MFLKKELTEYNRYQAFAVHMAISLVIFFILLVCITQYWYPGILFDTGNGWKAIGMIVGIDLVLGPLLTLIVFNHNKSSLKFDLAVIALVQTAALAYGTWTIHQTRPVALVLMTNKFITYYATTKIGQDIQEISQNNNYALLHKTVADNTTFELEADQFSSYQDQIHNNLADLKTYGLFSEVAQSILIPLDQHQDKNRFIEIDANTGKILIIRDIPLPKTDKI